jgi:zinc/manganese transport system ATP-binding protein
MTGTPAAHVAPALEVRRLTVSYSAQPVLWDVDAEFPQGTLSAVVGPNGAGKSTLLKGIVGEAARLSGGVDLHGLRVADLAYLPQQPEIDRTFPIAVVEFAAAGLWRRLGPWRGYRPEHRAEIAAALERVGLTGLEGRLIGTLSGGQMQRLLFARTLLQDARLILLDEPFAAIDAETEAALLRILSGWRAEGRTVLAALHDLTQVRAVFPQTLLLAGRPVAWGATEAVLTPANIARAYRRGSPEPSAPPGLGAIAALGAPAAP